MLRSHERGQAVFETALLMPLMIFSLFAVYLAVTEGAMSERVQLGVRYGGQIGIVQNPYLAYSLYAMYATIDGQQPDANTCNGSGADTTMLTKVRHSFWQPVASSVNSTCWQFSTVEYAASYSGFAHPGTATSANPFNMLAHENFIRLTTASSIPSALQNTLMQGSSEIETAAQNFIRPASIGDLMTCTYSGQAVKDSLEVVNANPALGYQYNAGGSIPGSTITSPFPTTLPDVITLPFESCNNFSGGQAAPPTAPPI